MATSMARQALREQQAREAEAARHKRMLVMSGLVLLVVLALVAAFWGAGVAKRKKAREQTVSGTALAGALQSIPAANFDAVGVGSANDVPQAIDGGKPQLVDGKPRVFYIGGEFCPYCAMDRLSLVSALSRFGTFQGLSDILSSPDEQVANVPTVTFRNAKFSSNTLVFDGVETADRAGKPLTNPTVADQAIFEKLVPKQYIPFVHFGSAFENHPPYDGEFLAGQQPQAVAEELKDPNSETSKAVLGGANVISAQICKETGNKPANVCTSAGVKAAAAQLR